MGNWFDYHRRYFSNGLKVQGSKQVLMKSIPKLLISWLLSLFNIGMYSVSDDIDSLIIRLNHVGLKKHANTILNLSETIEYQQSVILLLDGLKCVCMVISLVLLTLANKEVIQSFWHWLKNQFSTARLFLDAQLNNLIHFINNLF